MLLFPYGEKFVLVFPKPFVMTESLQVFIGIPDGFFRDVVPLYA